MAEEKEILVWTYSGYKADERPLRFNLEGRSFAVMEIVDRWYGERHDYFKVVADDAETYLIKWDRVGDVWYGERKTRS